MIISRVYVCERGVFGLGIEKAREEGSEGERDEARETETRPSSFTTLLHADKHVPLHTSWNSVQSPMAPMSASLRTTPNLLAGRAAPGATSPHLIYQTNGSNGKPMAPTYAES